jgi:hypothetical protein
MPDPHVYPDAAPWPLTLAPAATSSWLEIEQLNAGTQFVFMRVAMFTGVASLPPGDPTLPTISLRASSIPPGTTGDPVVLASSFSAVFAAPGSPAGSLVGSAKIVWQSDNVLLMTLKLFLVTTVAKWEIAIKNNTASNADFTWVVSSADANTVQPWLDVTPATLNYNLLKGGILSQSVQVKNKGTGPFTVDGVTPVLGNGFSLGALPPQLNPNTAAAVPITFTSDGTSPVTQQAVVAVTTTPADALATATPTPGHNKQVSLSASVGQLEIALLLDASGSMAWDACGNFLTAANANLARWSELKDAVTQFFGLLGLFGLGKGRVGVARFPGTNPADELTYKAVAPFDIPTDSGAANTQLTNALTTTFTNGPVDSTPMGDGLDHILGSAPRYFKAEATERDANQRWLLLMSDGANNINPSGHSPTQFISPDLGGSAAGATSFKAQKIRVYSAGYGIRGASNVDPTTLQNLASSGFTGSTFTPVDGTKTNTPDVCPPGGPPQNNNPILASQLAGFFRDVIKSTLTSPADPSATFLSGQSEARHDVLVTPYDGRAAFSLNWNTPQDDRLNLELLTPAHERINVSTIDGDFEGVSFISGLRFQTYLIDEKFMRGQSKGGESRFGHWTLIITPPPIISLAKPAGAAPPAAISTVFEDYTYDVMLESDLNLTVSLDQTDYYAGDPITVSAQLNLRGVPVSGATVTLSTTAPDQAVDNWLAGLTVTPDALKKAQDFLKGQDSTPLLVKSVAAGFMGLTFPGVSRETSTPMTEMGSTGLYQAVVTNTSTPESRKFYVTALGVTADGTSFRREGKVPTRVLVRPDPLFTQLNIFYPQAGLAQLTAIPRDRFNNVLLLNPDATGGFGFVAGGGGKLNGSLVSNLDGTYSQTLQYQPNQVATVAFQWHGQPVLAPLPLAPTANLVYVDRVIRFAVGAEGAPGANQHTDPQAALGDVFQKPAGQFVSLGARGALTVGVNHMVIVPSADNDVTVFIQPDADPRAYRVDVYAPPRPIFDDDSAHIRVRLMEFDATGPSHDIPIKLEPTIAGLDFGTLWIALQHQAGKDWTNVWASSQAGDLQWPVNRDKGLTPGRYRWAIFQADPAKGAKPIAITHDFALPQAGKVITLIDIDMTGLADYLGQWGLPPDDTKNWVHLGDSSGTTASFGLAKVGVKMATAIRISDLSGRILDDNGDPLSTPGVSVRGAGVLKVANAATFRP